MGPLREISKPDKRAVCDAGPIIHLAEVEGMPAFRIFTAVFFPEEVARETRGMAKKVSHMTQKALTGSSKNFARVIGLQQGVDAGESAAISLAVQEKISLFLTDDLQARDAARYFGLEPHGSLGILLRAFREGIFTKSKAIELVNLLHERSSLFLTRYLAQWTIREIEAYNPKR